MNKMELIKRLENIGSGFHKMIDGWKAHYKLKPIIDGDFDFYKITFPTTNKTTSKTTYKKYDFARENEITYILGNNGHFTAEDIARQIDLSVEGVRYHIKNLKKKGLLKRIGGKKKGYWELAG